MVLGFKTQKQINQRDTEKSEKADQGGFKNLLFG